MHSTIFWYTIFSFAFCFIPKFFVSDLLQQWQDTYYFGREKQQRVGSYRWTLASMVVFHGLSTFSRHGVCWHLLSRYRTLWRHCQTTGCIAYFVWPQRCFRRIAVALSLCCCPFTWWRDNVHIFRFCFCCRFGAMFTCRRERRIFVFGQFWLFCRYLEHWQSMCSILAPPVPFLSSSECSLGERKCSPCSLGGMACWWAR